MPTAESIGIVNTITALKAMYDAQLTETGCKTVYFGVDSGRLLQVELSASAGPDEELEEFVYKELVATAPQIVKAAARKRLEKLQDEIIQKMARYELRLDEMKNHELPAVEEALKELH